MKRSCAALAAFTLILALGAQTAWAAPARLLSKATLDRFLKDFPAMMAELEALGDEVSGPFEDIGGDEGMADPSQAFSAETIKAGLAAALADARVKAILVRYGWNDQFVTVYTAILSGYTYIMFEEIYKAYPMAEYKQYMDQMLASVHPDDIALVRANLDRIKAALVMDD